MAKTWKAGDYIPVDYVNKLELEVEKLKKESKNVGKNQSGHTTSEDNS